MTFPRYLRNREKKSQKRIEIELSKEKIKRMKNLKQLKDFVLNNKMVRIILVFIATIIFAGCYRMLFNNNESPFLFSCIIAVFILFIDFDS